jgi:hypothetical protein
MPSAWTVSTGVSFDDLFTTDFMRRFTDFLTLEEMFTASGYKIESTDDFANIPDDAWDAFIEKNTLFENWQEMREKAVSEWASRQLGFDE